MREIKLRAWHKLYGMIDVGILNSQYGSVDGRGSNMGRGCEYVFPIKDVELMQYTGLKDKNGKEIYEGDRVQFKWSNDNEVAIGQVKYCDKSAMFIWEWPCDLYESGIDYDDLTLFPISGEVIGNIYENPERGNT